MAPILFSLIAAFGYYFFARFISFFSAAPALGILPAITLIYGFSAIVWLPLFFWGSDQNEVSRSERFMERSAHFSMGFFSFLFCILLVRDFLLLFGFPFLRSPEANLALYFSGIAASWAGYRIAKQGPRVRKVLIRPEFPLPEGFSLRIAQISDLHVGSWIEKKYVEKMTEILLREGPIDLFCLTGDIGDGDPARHGLDLESIRKVKPALGSFSVSGNHEGYWDEKAWNSLITKLGVQVLDNESRLLEKKTPGGASVKIRVLGVSDPKPDLEKAMRELRAGGEESLNIFLAHQPKHATLISRLHGEDESQRIHLQLSGHTHAGQFIPWSGVIYLFQKYVRGLYRVDKLALYVNSGTGFWGPPNRLGTRSEITLIEVRSG